MVTVTIGKSSRTDSEIAESWVAEQISRRRRERVPICVTVQIREAGLNMTVRTADCGSGVGGGRPPTSDEQRVFDLWSKLHLDGPDFSAGNLVAFLKQWERA